MASSLFLVFLGSTTRTSLALVHRVYSPVVTIYSLAEIYKNLYLHHIALVCLELPLRRCNNLPRHCHCGWQLNCYQEKE